MTIEDRASAYASPFETRETHHVFSVARTAYIMGSYKQDRIARAEEREECVRAAQDWYRELRNEPKDSQWHDEVERDCVDLRNFIDHKRGSCDSYVTDELHEEIKNERERCIKAAQDAHCGMCSIYEVCHNLDGGNLGGDCNAKEIIRKAMEGGEG